MLVTTCRADPLGIEAPISHITGFIINILFTDENNSFFTVGKTFIYRETSLEKQSWKGDWKGNGGQVEGALCCRRLGVFEVSAAF